jgi:hypothetical protein
MNSSRWLSRDCQEFDKNANESEDKILGCGFLIIKVIVFYIKLVLMPACY